MTITLQALIEDIAELNGLTEQQAQNLYRDTDEYIDTWFREHGL